MRICIEARNGREAEFHPERSSVAVVGDVRIFEPPGCDLSELDVEYGERSVESKAADFHNFM